MLTLSEFKQKPEKKKEEIVDAYLKSRYSVHNPVIKDMLLQNNRFKVAIFNFINYLKTYDTHSS